MPEPSNKSRVTTGHPVHQDKGSAECSPDTEVSIERSPLQKNEFGESALPSLDKDLDVYLLLAEAARTKPKSELSPAETSELLSNSESSGAARELRSSSRLRLQQAIELKLIANISSFDDVHHPLVAEFLLQRRPDGKTRGGRLLVSNLGLFTGLNHTQIFDRLVEASPSDAQAAIMHFAHFKGVDPVYAAWRVVFVSDCASCLADNIEAFSGVDRVALVDTMMEPRIGAFAALARNVSKFPDLNHKRLVDCFLQSNPDFSETEAFLKHLSKLQGIDHSWLARALATKSSHTASALVESLSVFHDLNFCNLAELMIFSQESPTRRSVSQLLYHASESERRVIVERLLEGGDSLASQAAGNLQLFEDEYQAQLVERLLGTGPLSRTSLAKSISDLPVEARSYVADRILASDPTTEQASALAQHISFLDPSTHTHILQELLARSHFDAVGGNLERFEISDYEEPVRRILEARPEGALKKYLEHYGFDTSDPHKIAEDLRVRRELRSWDPFEDALSVLGDSQFNAELNASVLEQGFRRFSSLSQPKRVLEILQRSRLARAIAGPSLRFTPDYSEIDALAPLAEAGFHEQVLDVLSHYPLLDSVKLGNIFKAVAKGYILAGLFEKADRILRRNGISAEALGEYIVNGIAQDLDDENIVALFGVAAWLQDRPEVARLLENHVSRAQFDRYLNAFVPSKESGRTYNSPNEHFIRSGIPLLAKLRFFKPTYVEALLTATSNLIRRGASTAAAWSVHQANLSHARFDMEAPAFGMPRGIDIGKELDDLLSFYCNYSSLQAPHLYQEIRRRLRSSQPVDELDPKTISQRSRIMLADLLAGNLPVLLSDFDFEIFSGIVGGTSLKIRTVVQEFITDLERDRINPLDPRLKGKTFEFFADRLAPKAANDFAFSDASTILYQTFRDILLHIDLSGSTAAFQAKRNEVISIFENIVHEIAEKIPSVSEDRAKSMQRRRSSIETALDRFSKATSASEILQALCEYFSVEKGVKKHIRELALSLAFRDVKIDGRVIDALSPLLPTREGVEQMYELLHERVLFNPMFANMLGSRMASLKAAIGVASFDEDLHRLRKMDTRGSEKLLAVPTRGILGALSGFICDVCWSRQTDLMKRYPNATALIFVKNPDDPIAMRLEGGCMILTVKDNRNEDVLVINGLNPSKNLILGLNAKSFFEDFLENVVKPMAKALDVKKIAIPTLAPGSFFEPRTNRPSLAMYLTERCKDLPRITFESDRDLAVFNDNSFEKNCVLLWSATN